VLGAAALAGSQFWRRFNRRAHPSPPHLAVALAAVLLCAQAAGWYSRSPLGPVRFDPERYRATAHTAAIDRVLALVPPGAPVSAQSGLLPHLSQRRDIWEFPRLESAQFVVVDPTSWRSSQSTAAGYDDALRDLLSLGFCLLRADDGVMLFARGSPCASP
jgi:hypothetical protein